MNHLIFEIGFLAHLLESEIQHAFPKDLPRRASVLSRWLQGNITSRGDLPKPGHFEHVALNSWFLSSNRGEPPITPIVYGYIWLSITSFIMFYHVLSSLAIY